MKNAPDQKAIESPIAATASANDTPRHFYLTSNPRELRVIDALLVRSRTREDIDAIAGASNGPDLILKLRGRGLEIPCQKVVVYDRDGAETKRGVYSFTEADRRKIRKAIRLRDSRRAA
jgi:hypothetical protein